MQLNLKKLYLGARENYLNNRVIMKEVFRCKFSVNNTMKIWCLNHGNKNTRT